MCIRDRYTDTDIVTLEKARTEGQQTTEKIKISVVISSAEKYGKTNGWNWLLQKTDRDDKNVGELKAYCRVLIRYIQGEVLS